MENLLWKSKSKTSCKLVAVVAAGVLLLAPSHSRAQADIHFSQFYETSILRNPALTGVFEDDYKLGVYYRNQWSSITNPYNTMLFSAETHFPISERSDDFISFGLLGYEDKAGSVDQKIVAIYPAVNYNKAINPNHNTFLSVGFTGGYIQYSFDPSKATFNNQYLNGTYNPSNPSLENIPNAKFALWDVGAGVNYNTSSGENNNVSYIIGVSGYHFSQPVLSYYKNPKITENMRFNGNSAVTAAVSDNVSTQLQVNYALQGTYQEVMVGGLVNYAAVYAGQTTVFAISAGAFYRYGDAIIPVVKVKYQNMAVGISYDVNLSSLKEASNFQGGAEVTLFLVGNYTDKGVQKKTVCPKF
jgi:type IX secretion system PorP/SprF family membrane protein